MRFAVLACLLLCAAASRADETMEAEIDHLLAAVAASDCVFIRNGKEHRPEDARDHLAMKRRRGKRYYDNADEFIERIASKSSWSGKPYRIRCADGDTVTAGDWFSEVLTNFRRAEKISIVD